MILDLTGQGKESFLLARPNNSQADCCGSPVADDSKPVSDPANVRRRSMQTRTCLAGRSSFDDGSTSGCKTIA